MWENTIFLESQNVKMYMCDSFFMDSSKGHRTNGTHRQGRALIWVCWVYRCLVSAVAKPSLTCRGRSHGWHAACAPSGNAHPFHPGERCCVSRTREVLWEYFSLVFPTAWKRTENIFRQTLSRKNTIADWFDWGAHQLVLMPLTAHM